MMRHLSILLGLMCMAAAPATQPVRQRAVPASQPAEVNLTGVRLEDALEMVRDRTDLNIHINWKALELVNITRETPVSVRLRDVKIKTLLRAILADADPNGVATYYIDDGVVEVTTKEIADQKLITKVYPVQDLLMQVPDFAGPNVSLSNIGQSGGGRNSGGGNSNLFSDTNSNENTTPTNTNVNNLQSGEDLVKLIEQTVQPEAWRENGGTASIRYFNGHLVVTAPRSIHEALGGSGAVLGR
jgi:hypothetical protein